MPSYNSCTRLIARATLLAGTAMLATYASAADLPSRKAAPVSYMKICDGYGSGFFVIPGTETCVRLGGYVRAEVQYTPGQAVINPANGLVSQSGDAQDQTGWEVRGRLFVDARTPTELGTAQTYVRYRMTNASGLRRTSSPGTFSTNYNIQGSSTSPTMELAYVAVGGFKFGLIGDEYNNWPSGTTVSWVGDLPAGWSNGVMGLQYSKNLGNGFTGIIEIDDRSAAAHDQNTNFVNPGLLGPTTALSTASYQWNTFANLIGVLDYQASWGSARFGAVVGNNSTTNGPTEWQEKYRELTEQSRRIASTIDAAE